jgi:nucleotide-binding universal stress UspA family protein
MSNLLRKIPQSLDARILPPECARTWGGRRHRCRISVSALEKALARPPERRLHDQVSEAIMIELKTILVPTDFSECSEAAVKYGAALAQTFGATLHLLNVVQDPYSLPWSADGFAAPVGDMLADWEAQAKGRLAESVPGTAAANAVVTTRIGSPYTEIVRYAAQNRIDLIVLGTHGRGPLGHILLGSVAERVVRTAPCPVLTVRHPQREFVVENVAEIALEAAGAALTTA